MLPEPSRDPLTPYAPREAHNADFARRLQAARVDKGWNQSELAREAAKHMLDKKFGRDLISSYERAKMMPGAVHLSALSKALGVKSDTLIPSSMPQAGEPNPPMETRDMGDGRVWLRLNQAVPMSAYIAILNILNKDRPDGHSTPRSNR